MTLTAAARAPPPSERGDERTERKEAAGEAEGDCVGDREEGSCDSDATDGVYADDGRAS